MEVSPSTLSQDLQRIRAAEAKGAVLGQKPQQASAGFEPRVDAGAELGQLLGVLKQAQQPFGPPDAFLSGSGWKLPAHKEVLKVKGRRTGR